MCSDHARETHQPVIPNLYTFAWKIIPHNDARCLSYTWQICCCEMLFTIHWPPVDFEHKQPVMRSFDVAHKLNRERHTAHTTVSGPKYNPKQLLMIHISICLWWWNEKYKWDYYHQKGNDWADNTQPDILHKITERMDLILYTRSVK